MSSVTKAQWQLARRLIAGEISDGEFCTSIGTTIGGAVSHGVELLRDACAKKDAHAVEFGLFIGHRFGVTDRHLDVLLQLADADWHTQHENVVRGLAQLRSPESVESLYRLALARFDYLDYDESFALGVKAIWALGDIATTIAVDRLRDIMSCDNRVLVENAARQLDRIASSDRSKV